MLSNGTMGMARWRSDSRELLTQPIFQLPRTILTRTGTPGSIVDVTRDHTRFLLSLLTADLGVWSEGRC